VPGSIVDTGIWKDTREERIMNTFPDGHRTYIVIEAQLTTVNP
jgi:hypothetical protein